MVKLKCTNCGENEEFEDAICAATCGFVEGWTAFNGEVYCFQCGLMYERLHTCGGYRSGCNDFLNAAIILALNTTISLLAYPIKRPKEKYDKIFSTLSARERLEIYCRKTTNPQTRAKLTTELANFSIRWKSQ